MSRFIFDLTDDDRAALERLRINMGLRSHAEVLRELIRRGGGEPALAEAPVRPPLPRRGSVEVVPPKRPRAAVAAPKGRTLIGFDMGDKPIYR